MQPQKVNIDINKSKLVKCECGNPFYQQVIIMREISGVLVGQAGKNVLSTIPIMICTECKKPHTSSEPYLKEPESVKEEPTIKLIN